MTTRTPQKPSRPRRWLALAGVAIGLTAPLTASAHADDNGVMEVIGSAAIAYTVIDLAGGFDKHGHKHHRDYRNDDRYRWRGDRYHDHYRDDHRRRDWYAYQHQPWGHDHKRCKGHDHGPAHRGPDRDYRYRSYH